MNARERFGSERFPIWTNTAKVSRERVKLTSRRNNAARVFRMIAGIVLQNQRIVVEQCHELYQAERGMECRGPSCFAPYLRCLKARLPPPDPYNKIA